MYEEEIISLFLYKHANNIFLYVTIKHQYPFIGMAKKKKCTRD